MRNMKVALELEKSGVPVIPATGNNVSFAQAKMTYPGSGEKIRDLSCTPGIYCNGALVKGYGGKEIMVKALGSYLETFVGNWCDGTAPNHKDICIGGLTPDRALLLRPQEGGVGVHTGEAFLRTMMVVEGESQWMDQAQFAGSSSRILSLLVLFPEGTTDAQLIETQQWLTSKGLFEFPDSARKGSGVLGDQACCKHVHVPGLGPEIDISPLGVNKGSAITVLLEDAKTHLEVDYQGNHQIAVFGDAGNDIELFGMRQNSDGTGLEPLANGFRPVVRVAMPWANDALLTKDANVICTVDVVLAEIMKTQSLVPGGLPGGLKVHECRESRPESCEETHKIVDPCCDTCVSVSYTHLTLPTKRIV
eukprot:TRINITY_DN40350_c0_g1_i1.p1 TRINITY_DN40350_c0_g1~~TRINITY_DN40350_c0_g1_i1.p1  ORF type:complete len:363 (+),score=68.13 TRINITY_DN40350_c0_g1_i1:146-1234(+)